MPKVGSLRKKGTMYYYRYMYNGKQKEVSTGCTSKREAEKKADEIYQAAISTPPPNPELAFKTIAKKFLEHEKRRTQGKTSRPLAITTYHEKERIIENHLIAYFKDLNLAEITVYQIEDYYSRKLEDGIAANTIRKHAVYLNQLFRFARKNRLIDYNPAEDADRPKYVKSTAAKTWTAQQAQAYLSFLRQSVKLGQIRPFYELAVHLALLGGCRREECCGLRFSHIEIVDNKVQVALSEAITTLGNTPITKDLKNHDTRVIYLPEQSVPIFNTIIIRHKEAILKYGAKNIGDYVCGDELFHPTNPNVLTNYHKKILQQRHPSDQYPYIRFHDLRHTLATLLSNNKVNIPAISDLLGHKTKAVTLDMYIHTNKENQIETADITANIFNQKHG